MSLRVSSVYLVCQNSDWLFLENNMDDQDLKNKVKLVLLFSVLLLRAPESDYNWLGCHEQGDHERQIQT